MPTFTDPVSNHDRTQFKTARENIVLRSHLIPCAIFAITGSSATVSVMITNLPRFSFPATTGLSGRVKFRSSDGVVATGDLVASAANLQTTLAIPAAGVSRDAITWVTTQDNFDNSFTDIAGTEVTVVPGGRKQYTFRLLKKFFCIIPSQAGDGNGVQLILDVGCSSGVSCIYHDHQRANANH